MFSLVIHLCWLPQPSDTPPIEFTLGESETFDIGMDFIWFKPVVFNAGGHYNNSWALKNLVTWIPLFSFTACAF